VPIRSISRKSTNDKFSFLKQDDEPGPVFVKLLAALKDIQQGKLEDKFGWLESVKKAKNTNYRVDNTGGVSNNINGHC
jgi:branched-chain amino acid aminotransferase